ncbi:bifunctional (p)ppGpp synthetase/guanosine-3',5'-bis(diphosphate) 3'-pyrophosphohydrolase [Candidatus Woesearchaeota archaeon]|nr:bifunctional (p)ppGpp synthetase/guanosine-3',5'-bis(diphosphate) 3'-pyrophosphohydrolase [Candidatus Woesearchaeota archaeon]
MTIKELIKRVKSYNPKANIKLITAAYDFASEQHKEQKRESGEPFFQHCEEVAYVLAELKLNSVTIAAGLLHDVLEDTKIRMSKLDELFGREVAGLVEGVTKIERIDLELSEETKAANLRKILLATIKDVRVILIKLADRLHNMRTLKYLKAEKQLRIAQETIDIYAPIAHKLGIYKIKSELEDLALRFLNPEVYQDLKLRIAEKKEIREEKIKEVVSIIKKKLKEQNIQADVYGRAKTFYSIYKKLQTRKKVFDDIYDLLAFRIITRSVEDCYKILGIIHSNWRYLPSKFSDYIANPKPNGYQSIHTKILFKEKPIEIQIRTEEMHFEAEEGIAAHWRYKGTERDKRFDRKIAWLRQILEWERTSENAKDFIETLKIDIFKDEIIVFTPKGEPIALPEGSSPIDFAYEIHTNIGNHCVRAKVNNLIVPLDHKLSSGDVVEIQTSNKAVPSRQWLNFVRTSQAKSKIRQTLNIEAERRKKKIVEDVTAADVIVENVKKPEVRLSKCCMPSKSDTIYGFKMKDGRIAIHTTSCPNVNNMDQSKRVAVKWKKSERTKKKKLTIVVQDRVGILADILNKIADYRVNISSINSKAKREHIVITMVVEVARSANLEELVQKIMYTPNVIDVIVV